MAKKQKDAINLANNEKNCFEYALTAPLNYQENKSHPERI